MRRGPARPERLDRVLQESLGGRRLATLLADAEIIARWAEVVGPAVAARARPEALRDGVLVVRVASSPWMTELSFLKPALLARLHALAGGPHVTDIRLVAGALPAAPPPPSPPPSAAPLSPEQGRRVEALTAEVRDPLLKEAIARAYGRALACEPRPPAGVPHRRPR
jgi:hypothetical protein